MTTYPGWPNAAKAVIEHEFVGSSLMLYLTFPEAMNQTVKPVNTKFHVLLDGEGYSIYFSSWFDAYTLVLSIIEVTGPPERVTLSYDGPGPDVWLPDDPSRKTLETTTHKQWEPWGEILSLDITTPPP